MSRGVGHLLATNEAVPAIDADVRFVAEGGDREVTLRGAVGLDLALAGLEGPTRIRVFLRRLGGLFRPDLGRFLAGLDRRLLRVGIALARCRHQARIDDLPRHRQIAGILDRFVETGKQLVQGTGPDQRLAEVPQRVRVRHRVGDRETTEPHPSMVRRPSIRSPEETRPAGRGGIADRAPDARSPRSSPVLRLQIQHLELQDRVERRPATQRPLHAA
jgi:hypothetical protein